MRTFGGLLFVAGVILIVVAFNFDTTVYSSPSFVGGEMIGGGSTHNLGLLQRQMMILHTGLGAGVAGAIFISHLKTGSVALPNTPLAEPITDEEEIDRQRQLVSQTHKVIGASLAFLLLAISGLVIFTSHRSGSYDASLAARNLEAAADEMDRMADNMSEPGK